MKSFEQSNDVSVQAHHSSLEIYEPKSRRVILATGTCFIMIMAWLISLLTPFYLCKVFLFEDVSNTKVTISLLSFMAIAYAPWPCSSRLRSLFACSGEYFKKCSIVYEEPFVEASKPTKLLCVHPHGIVAMGWGVLFNRPELEKVQFIFSSQLYWSPAFHLFTRMIGHPNPSDKKTFLRLMRSQESMALIPGGFEEATIHSDASNRVYIKKRFGFIKYALQYGYALVPSYCFGENKTFSNCSPWNIKTGLWLNSWGFVGALACGRWCFFPFMPRNEDMHIVVGKALQLPRIEHPSVEQIYEYHTEYVNALLDLFDRHKEEYHEHGHLEVW